MKIIISILFAISYVVSYGQENIRKQVIEKLTKDKIAYKQFRYYGTLHCLDENLDQDGSLLIYGYGENYNSFYPFPRLIDMEVLKNVYKIYEILEKHQRHDGINQVRKCSKIYRKNSTLKRLYINLINNSNSYYKTEELEDYMRQYLEKYYINIQTN